MEDTLIVNRDGIVIEGNRNLYNYRFREATNQDRLNQMIQTGEVGVIGPFLDAHSDLDLPAALDVARQTPNPAAMNEISMRLYK